MSNNFSIINFTKLFNSLANKKITGYLAPSLILFNFILGIFGQYLFQALSFYSVEMRTKSIIIGVIALIATLTSIFAVIISCIYCFFGDHKNKLAKFLYCRIF